MHVTNGDSVANTLRQTSLGGPVLSWPDVLAFGPVPRVPPHELRRVRAEFLAAHGWGVARDLEGAFEARDRQLVEAEHVVLWFEHDLHDQLQLLQILDLRDGDMKLIQTDVLLGPLHAHELEPLFSARVPVTDAQRELAARAWDAVRAESRDELDALLASDTRALPHLASALHRLLEELPDEDGLSRTDRQLLGVLADGPRTRLDAFFASQRLEETPYAGDAWIFERLRELAGLVRQNGAVVELTDLGRRVLAGDANRIEEIGVDRWVGGIHVQQKARR